MSHNLSKATLLSGLEFIQGSPQDKGKLDLIVIRPKENERTVLVESEVSSRLGVHGDRWAMDSWKTFPDGSPHPDVQITLMNSRFIALLAQEKSRWPLARDQLFVDLDLIEGNLPAGKHLPLMLQYVCIPCFLLVFVLFQFSIIFNPTTVLQRHRYSMAG